MIPPANTAIFFDIENLIGGYGSDVKLDISLKDIVAKIDANDQVIRVAIKKAYANWSDRRLVALREDITALGIEPVQMFGFSKGIIKNASDIQLVLDAADIIHTHPTITTYVIVSGDGGFGALANRLTSYGKFVIGCAEKKSCNGVFKALCDDFITVDLVSTKQAPAKNKPPTPKKAAPAAKPKPAPTAAKPANANQRRDRRPSRNR
jgi:uncharacterized LabA/DUF88 family protein